MRIESLELTMDSDELEGILKNIDMPQYVRIRRVYFEPGQLLIQMSIIESIPLYPTLHISVIQASGQTISLHISAPPLEGPAIPLSWELPKGIAYLGRGVVSLGMIELSKGIISSIKLDGVQLEKGYATITIAEMDINTLGIIG